MDDSVVWNNLRKAKLARSDYSCHSLPCVEYYLEGLLLDSSCFIFVCLGFLNVFLLFFFLLGSIIDNLEPLSILLFGISIIYENKSKVLFVLL